MKKILVISSSILLSLSILLSACGSKGNEEQHYDGDVSTAGSTEPETTYDPLSAASFIPEGIRFEGKIFNIIYASGYDYIPSEISLEADEIVGGDIISESVYERNRLVEEKLGVKINGIKTPSGWENIHSNVEKSVMAGDNAYDAVGGAVYSAYHCAKKGLLFNLADLPSFDLSHPWWSKHTAKTFNFGTDRDIVYFINGDIDYYDNYGSTCILFNRKMMDDFGIEAPYGLVRDHKWTYERFVSMYKNVYNDVDGDNKKSFGDIYGLVSNVGAMNGFISGFDMSMYVRSGDHYTVNQSETLVSAIDALCRDFVHQDSTWFDQGEYSKIFYDNRALFSQDNMGAITEASKEMDDTYGILPYPLWDESQEQYICVASEAYATAFGLITTTDQDSGGYILDAMGAYSVDTVTEAVINTGCMIKSTRDEDAADMLHLIMDSAAYSMESIARWGNMNALTWKYIASGINNYISDSEERKERIENTSAADLESLAYPDN